MNTQPTFTKPWFRMLPDEPASRLRDGDNSFGQIEADRRAKIRIRERDKKRRQRALSTCKPRPAPAELFYDACLFETPSGIVAYRKLIPNKVAVSSSPIYSGTAHESISLPWVSILGSMRSGQ